MSLRKTSNAAEAHSEAEGMNMSLLQGLLVLGIVGAVLAAVAEYLL